MDRSTDQQITQTKVQKKTKKGGEEQEGGTVEWWGYGKFSHLDRTRQQMPIMRQTSRKRRSIIKRVWWTLFAQLQLSPKCINLLPKR